MTGEQRWTIRVCSECKEPLNFDTFLLRWICPTHGADCTVLFATVVPAALLEQAREALTEIRKRLGGSQVTQREVTQAYDFAVAALASGAVPEREGGQQHG